METTEQILERQYANFNFRNGKVEYFSISTQHDRADTIEAAIQNILDADAKYNGKSPLAHVMNMNCLHIDPLSEEEFAKLVEVWNGIGLIFPVYKEDIEVVIDGKVQQI